MVQKYKYKLSQVWVSSKFTSIVRYKILRMISLMILMFPSTAKVGTPAEYYTLESLLFFLKNESLPHPAYIQQATVSYIGS